MYKGTNSGKRVLWQEMWRHELMEALEQAPVVIVPVGSVEQHGPHCPLDVDIAVPFHIALRAAELVDGFPVLVVPPVWAGVTHYNMGFVGTINLRLETFINYLADVCRSIHANGLERIVLVNGHGGNVAPVKAVSADLAQYDVYTVAVTYWEMVERELAEWSEYDGDVGHCGEWETSLMLYLRDHMVARGRMVLNDDRPDGFSPEVAAYAGFPERRREWPDGVDNNPFVASREKGERLFSTLVEKLVALVREYHAVPVRHYQQFGSHCP